MPRPAEAYIGEKGVYGCDTCGKQQAAIIYNPVKEFLRNLMQIFPLLAIFVGGEILDMVLNTGAVAKAVLLILLAFSVISWAIILTKWSLLRLPRVQSGRFGRAFRKAQRMQDIAAVADQFRPSPLVGIFEGGYEEYKRQVTGQSALLRSITGVQRGMQIGASEEVTRLERNLPWLAI